MIDDGILAQLRRLYLHVVHGGTVTADDLAAMIRVMEMDNSRGLMGKKAENLLDAGNGS